MSGPHHAPAPSVAAVEDLSALRGTVLEGRYRLGEILGAGGMGAVFEAEHLRLERKVAIKVLRPIFVGHKEFIQRFLREAKAASTIRHRNVVEILDFGEAEGGLVYSVMEFLRGRDLDQLLRSHPDRRLPWSQAHGLLVQIARGLQAAHACGVIHRDIKPANCFLTDEDGDPVIKVVDFGIAKIHNPDHTQQFTGTAEILGTPAYIAPELIRTKDPVGPQSDVYSLGVLAYALLAGRLPFTGATSFEILHCSCFEPVPPLRPLVPDLPLGVEALVLQMLAKDPAERPPGMRAVREMLLRLGEHTLGPQAPIIPDSRTFTPGVEASDGHFGIAKTTPHGLSAREIRESTYPHDTTPSTEIVTPLAEFSRDFTAPHGGPRSVTIDAARAPSERDETLPTSSQGPLDRSDRPRVLLWTLGGLAAIAVAGTTLLAMTRDNEGEGSDREIAGTQEVESHANTEPDVGTIPGGVAASSKPTPAPESEVEPATAVDPATAIEPATAVETTDQDRPASSPSEADDPTDRTSDETRPTSKPARPPRLKTNKDHARALKRRIKSNCGHSTSEPIEVSFIVIEGGRAVAIRVVPADAKACVEGSIKASTTHNAWTPDSFEFTVRP